MKYEVGDIVKPRNPTEFAGYWTQKYGVVGDPNRSTFTIKEAKGNTYKLEELTFNDSEGWFIDWFEKVETMEEPKKRKRAPKKVKSVTGVEAAQDFDVTTCEIVSLADLPLGRIGKLIDKRISYLYVAHCNPNEYLRMWLPEGRMSVEGLRKKDMPKDWKLYLLPEGTSVTLTFKGPDDWQGEA
jgi:hypothetical protein